MPQRTYSNSMKKMFTCNEKHGDAYKSKLLLFHEYLFIETKLAALNFMISSSSYKVFDDST